jgi:acetolactate synthase-1/3 small subunit
MENKNEKHTMIAWMQDKPGVLNRVSGLFSRRNFNIESLTVGHSETAGISRMTFVSTGTERDMRQVKTQLNKIINITKVEDVTDKPSVIRELALIKVNANGRNRHEIIQMAEIHRAQVVDVTIDSLVVQITAKPDKVDSLISLMAHFGIIEMVRTGSVAMVRSEKKAPEAAVPASANGHM